MSELNLSIYSYLKEKGFKSAAEALKKETNLVRKKKNFLTQFLFSSLTKKKQNFH